MNVVPLIDVLLVLLIIFMVTAPIATHEIQVDLPQRSKNEQENPKDPPPPVRLRIDQSGALFWDNMPLPRAALAPSLQIETMGKGVDEQPTLEIEASPEVEYEVLTQVLATARNVGVIKIGFVETM
ncbi:MAG: biopolymer transporter ExbD [Lysobacteraceae bacterium]